MTPPSPTPCRIPAPALTPGTSSRLPALDGLRGIAVLAVMLHHFSPWQPGDSGYRAFLAGITASGWAGVDLFFVLSGFLITGILYETRSGPHYFRTFYARRALRIFPAYYAVAAAMLLLLPALDHFGVIHLGALSGGQSSLLTELTELRHEQAWFWLYGMNILACLGQNLYVLNHTWTLAIEEHYYLLWPLIVYLLPRRGLLFACAAMIIIALGLRITLPFCGGNWDMASYLLTPCRMDGLAIGSALAILARSTPQETLVRAARIVFLITGVLLLAHIAWRHRLDNENYLLRSVGLTVLSFFFAAALTLAVTASPASLIGRFAANRLLVFLGIYSYGIYLFHRLLVWPMARFAGVSFFNRLLHFQPAAEVLSVLAAIAATVGLAFLSWHLYEKQFLKLKKYFAYPAPVLPMPGI